MTTPTYFRELTGFDAAGQYVGFAQQDGERWQVWRRSTDLRAWGPDKDDPLRRRLRLKAPKIVGTERKAREMLSAMGATEIEDSRGGLTLATDDEPELIAG